ncbi:unnamed protein product [Euphydryas editha]|uniref:ribonuclease H n=1 Tax=Euphydryas editha TaxID=104508 RepID=A0AAU9TUY2_EUPED|nr:unnamed protein product [Euphydryas editha]
MEKEPMLLSVSDKFPKQFVFDKKYKIQLHEDPNEALNTKDVRIFTDGSKTESGTGYGVFSEDLNIQIATPLGAHNTVYQAECMGIIAAASATLVRKVKDYSIRILSDSRSVLQALQSHSITSRLIYNCHQSLMEVRNNNNNVTLQWIKGHSGSRGNDADDELARRGSEMAAIGSEPIVPLPTVWPTSVIRQQTKQLHNKYWMEVLPTAPVQSLPGGRGDGRPHRSGVHGRDHLPGQTSGVTEDSPEVIGDTRDLINFLQELGWQD